MNSSAIARSSGVPRRLALQRFVAREELLHLHRVVGERFGRGVDRGQAAADHHDRQADLQVGDRFVLRRAGELQRHEEVGGGAHAAREAVRDLEHRRPAGTGAQRDVVEAVGEGFVDGQRAAEAHAAEHRELAPPLEQQADDLEEVLVPAHRDAVLGDAAEARHGAVVERLAQLANVLDRLERDAVAQRVHAGNRGIERLDLQAVDADHGVAVVHQVVRDGEAGRPEADDQHLFPDGAFG